MEFIEIRADNKAYMSELKKWLKRDFPVSERTPFYMIRRLIKQGKISAYIAVDDSCVCGYTVLHIFKGMMQVLYLAVMPSFRGKGAGSKMIRMIRDKAAGMPLVLEVEDPSVAKEDDVRQLRLRRIAFYERAGLSLIKGVTFRCAGATMKVMSDRDISYMGYLPQLWLDMYYELLGCKILRVLFSADDKD